MTKSDIDLKSKFHEFLKKLNLKDKFPQKLSIRDAMTISEELLGVINTTDRYEMLPLLVLQKMMMSDYRCRSCLFHKKETSKVKIKCKFADSDSDTDSDSEDEDKLHPVDCILTLLHCCDDILRQLLIFKMSLCQLAVPLLLPNPANGSITLLLWAMRSLVKGWKSYKKEANSTDIKIVEIESRIVDYKAPIVSFLRLGRQTSSISSKSEILNTLIGGESKYFFYRRGCAGGDHQRNFVDGLVELCCYFPAGKNINSDSFTDAIMFLNLRGDAQTHPKQVEFLAKISFASLVVIDEAEILKSEYVNILSTLSGSPGGVTLLIAKNNASDSLSKDLKVFHQTIPKNKCSKIKLKTKNLDTIKSEIVKILFEKLFTAPSNLKPIAECFVYAREIGILVDEDNPFCLSGKLRATEIMKLIPPKAMKNEMLPLQGPELWHKWAKYDKEKHRHRERKKVTDVRKYNSMIESEKVKIRKAQYDRCSKLSPMMECFIKHLLDKNFEERKYFLLWLKVLLDDHSRKVLPELTASYQNTRNRLLELKHKNQITNDDAENIQKLRKTLQSQNRELILASFGTEHLFRELGQIYEACAVAHGYPVESKFKEEAERFPEVIGEIMCEGHALELMDGDASHVPLNWVTAVIKKLKIVCGKNKQDGKIFVLSVLGILSSGKSTLLNTMFGSCFNVSVGRCTRGAYIQLLPFNDSLKVRTNCDYLLIVDTEGLRAPELHQVERLKHDNELATFVIGLADATIINIFGETPGDLSDILQTSLHAFIRMRKVGMKPSCQFVHQNVADALASSKSLIERQKFHNWLDIMTEVAAKGEACDGQYRNFYDVISFDDSKDVFYFRSLWKGDPPMASVNIGYIDDAQQLKTALIDLSKHKKYCKSSLEDFKTRIKGLCNALLQENFVFSFKNTLEVVAYNELDNQYSQWSWELQDSVIQWQITTKSKIKNCDSNDLDRKKDECIRMLENNLKTTHQKLCDDMISFINTNVHVEILSQWINKMETNLQELCEQLKAQGKKLCEDLVKIRINKVEIEKLQNGCITELQALVRQLVRNLDNGQKLTQHEKTRIFEKQWDKWIEDFQTNKMKQVKYLSDYEIESEIVSILMELMKSHEHLLISELGNKPLSKRDDSLKLCVIKDTHLQLTSYWKWSIGEQEVVEAQTSTNKYTASARKYLESKRNELFDSRITHTVLKDLLDSIRCHHNSTFVFTPEYKIDISLVVCSFAYHMFKKSMNLIRKENDPMEKLKALKENFQTTFENLYSKVNHEKVAAKSLCILLEKSIKKAVEVKVGSLLVKDLKESNPCFRTKRSFKIELLTELAKQEKFSYFEQYLDDIDGCFQYWTEYYLRQHFVETDTGKSRMSILAEKQLLAITNKIRNTVKELKSSGNINIKVWLNAFHNRTQEICDINKNEIEGMVGIYDIMDYHYFLADIKKGIHEIETKLLRMFSDGHQFYHDVKGSENPPQLSLYKSLIGCIATCPFCKEQCEKINPSHSGKHEIKLHRPKCLGKCMCADTQKLITKTCTEADTSEDTFQCDETEWKPIPCTRYAEYFPSWNISTTCTYESLYWQWFVSRFETEVVRWARASGIDIPGKWKQVSKEAAQDSLLSFF